MIASWRADPSAAVIEYGAGPARNVQSGQTPPENRALLQAVAPVPAVDRKTGVARIAATMSDQGPNPEPDKERIDRELIELLNELRVALPGVQVLFAFLLILPFQQRFESINALERWVYFGALLASAGATALLITPSVYHRLNFRRKNKGRMLFDSNRLLLAGSALTAVGIACSIFLVTDVVFGSTIAVAATVGTLVVYAALWAALPLARRREPDE